MAEAGNGSAHTPLTPEWTPATRASHYPWQGDRPAAAPSVHKIGAFLRLAGEVTYSFCGISGVLRGLTRNVHRESVCVIAGIHGRGHPKTAVAIAAKDLFARSTPDERPVGVCRHTAALYLCDV